VKYWLADVFQDALCSNFGKIILKKTIKMITRRASKKIHGSVEIKAMVI
jgi:hypothetical protein